MRYQMTYEVQLHVEAPNVDEARVQVGQILAYILSPDEHDADYETHIIRPPLVHLRSVIDSKKQPVEVSGASDIGFYDMAALDAEG